MDITRTAEGLQKKIESLSLTAVYQPVSTDGPEEIKRYRNDVKDLIARIPEKNILIIGDNNAHIGKDAKNLETCGGFGINVRLQTKDSTSCNGVKH